MASIVSFTFREALVDVEYEGEDLMKLFDRVHNAPKQLSAKLRIVRIVR